MGQFDWGRGRRASLTSRTSSDQAVTANHAGQNGLGNVPVPLIALLISHPF